MKPTLDKLIAIQPCYDYKTKVTHKIGEEFETDEAQAKDFLEMKAAAKAGTPEAKIAVQNAEAAEASNANLRPGSL